MAPVFDINRLLAYSTGQRASDLHLQMDRKPLIRVDGSLRDIEEYPVLDETAMTQLLQPLLNDDQKKQYRENKSVDFSHAVPGVARFRVNLFVQQGKMGAVFRRIPEKIPTLDELAAPAALLDFAKRPRGLVLVTGPTGSGKSTTLAATLDAINSTRADHILTIEDPIEFVHSSKRCLINQREIGRDCPNFARGLRDALREDPDVILVGEMRDLETMQLAITAAETGHLVFGTVHTSSAPSAVDRIVDAFPAAQQQQVRVMLAESLIGVVTQALLPRADGEGRVAAHEVMVVNNPVRNHIRKQETGHIRSVMQTQTKEGMQTLDRALVYLVAQNIVAEDVARGRAQHLTEFDQLLTRFRRTGELNPPRLVTPGLLAEHLGLESGGAAEAEAADEDGE